jgi:hypothetical protein
MQSSAIPPKFALPWAANAATTGGPNGDGYRRPIPTASQIGIIDGAASLADGFPPLNAAEIAAGAVPPFIQDANGILYQISAWTQWTQAGGPVYWDSTFAASAAGGYPKGALLASAVTPGLTWQSTVDANTANPEAATANWTARAVVASTVTALARDANGNGGIVVLNPSQVSGQQYSPVDLDNHNGVFRVFTGGTVGLSYDPVSYTLTIGSGSRGRVSAIDFTAMPDANGNHVYYFVDAAGNQTGHVLQDINGAIHLNTGVQDATLDASGNFVVPSSLTVSGGNVYAPNGIVEAISFQGSGNGSVVAGTSGVTSNGPVSAQSNFNLYGRNFTMYRPNPNGGTPLISGQLVYNNVTPATYGPQTEMWCDNATLFIDSSGAAYTRANFGTANPALARVNTTAVSERRLKQDIVLLDGADALARLAAAPAVRFRYTAASGLDPQPVHIGNIYEDIAASMPEAAIRVGGTGQVQHDMKTPYLQAALVHLAARVEALEAKLAAMAS